MRLSDSTLEILRDSLLSIFGETHVYLFGSRVDDDKKGGDIDIAVKTDMTGAEFRKKKILFYTILIRRGFDFEVDLVQYCDGMDKLLEKEISASSIRIL